MPHSGVFPSNTEGAKNKMLNPQSIIEINRKISRPLVVQAMFYDLDDNSGFIFSKKLDVFECLCPYCIGFTRKLTTSHFVNTAQKPKGLQGEAPNSKAA